MPHKKYIAIVDYDAMFRKELMKIINLFTGYSVVLEVSDGKDFMAHLNPKKRPEIVLMNMTVPKMGGNFAAEWLNLKYPDIKLLALSTIDSEPAIVKMIKAGARGCVLKDADPGALKLALDEVMAKGFTYNDHITRKVILAVGKLVSDKDPFSIFTKLTEREIELLRYVCSEMSYKEISGKMFLSTRTLEGYWDILCGKLLLRTRS